MKRILKCGLSLILALTFVLSSAYVGLCEVDFDGIFAVKTKAASSGTCGDNLTWTLDAEGTLTISGTGEMDDFKIAPAWLNGPLYCSAPWCATISGAGLVFESVVIDNGVTSIGDNSFWKCTALDSISIPDSVTSIGDGAFEECTSLTSITIPDSVTSIGEYAFRDCTSLTSATIGDGVKSIGGSAFYNCTSLTSITIPDSVTSIGGSAFYNTGYYNDTNNWENGVLYIGNHLIEVKGSISGAYVIKEGTKTIADYAFYDCTNLTSITIPDSVTSIGDDAFYKCSSLTSITIPGSVTSIGAAAFRDCTSLTSITIPDSVTSIGHSAFYNTDYYNDTDNWENDVLYIGNHFIKAKNTISGDYVIKKGTKTIASSAFSGCTSLTSVTIPDSVTSIGGSAFYKCTNLTTITIPDSVTSIDESAFGDCTSLTSITIPGSVTSIGAAAFRDCTSLTSITIPDSVTSIDSCAFYKCTSLASVTIGDSLTSIGDEAFYECTSLESVTIPDSVTSIGEYAFRDCTNLTSVTIGDGVTSIGKYVFGDCTSLTSITISDSVTSIGEFAFYNCTSLTSITIPKSVTSVGDWVFRNCTGLTAITIPKSVTSIGGYAFYECTSLKNVYYSGSKEQWNNINIGEYNTSLTSANITYNYSDVPVVPEEPEESKFKVASGSKNKEYDYYYNDSFFDKKATVYNHELATMSLCLALSSFQSDKAYITYLNAKNLLKDCGFKEFEHHNYDIITTADDIGCLFAQKPIGDTTLVTVVVRSGGYDKEWASNLTVGYTGDHKGFDEASDIVLKELKNYIKQKGILGDVKFWIAGYSRGAATATQTAAKLNFTSIDGVSFSKNSIYAYGFATPAGAIKSNNPTDTSKYGNIFNIVNFHDIVPKVAPEKWNFTRYGKTFYLPFSDSSGTCQIKEASVRKWFEEHGLKYKIDEFVAYYYEAGDGKILGSSNDSLGVFSTKLVDSLARSIGARSIYTLTLQETIRTIWTKKNSLSLDAALHEILVVLGRELVSRPQYIVTGISANRLLVEAHDKCGAYYLGWMQTMPKDLTEKEYLAQGYFTKGTLRELIYNCPVDVYVYDTNGKLVAAVENDKPVEIEGSTFSYGVDENGQKYFFLPVDAEYDIKVVAREDCETTCTVNEFTNGETTENRVVTFTEIQMEKNEEVSMSTEAYSEDDIVEGSENGSSAEYVIQDETEQIIEPDVDVSGEEIENYTYNVTVEYDENKGIVYGGGEFTIGQFCQVIAENKPGYKFSKWTVNGETVSTETTYRFAVKEDVTIVVEYVPCEHPKYIAEVVEPTCTEEGYTKHTCEVCTHSYNDTIVKATGHKLTDWIIDKKATVNAPGKKHKECTVCDKTIKTATIKQLRCLAVKLSKVANVGTGVKVYWSKVTGADSYRVYRKTKSSGWKVLGETSKAYFTDKTAKSGTVYYYSVRAINEAGLGAVCKTTKSLKCLADPTLKVPTSSRSGITLKWTKTTGASGYVIYRKAGNGSYKKLVTEKGVSNLSYVDKTAKKGTTYTYKVRAYYGKTYSAYSNTRQIKDKY